MKSNIQSKQELCTCGHDKSLHGKTLHGSHSNSGDICYGYNKLDRLCSCMKFKEKT